MNEYLFLRLSDKPALLEAAALWFHENWGIDREIYLASMRESLKDGAVVPRWYLVLDGEKIIAGAGVIENDFHPRHDLTPNVCAVFTLPAFRGQGIAGRLLAYICRDMAANGTRTLYLLTDHIGFYERYGWTYLEEIRSDDGELSRVYMHKL